MNHVCKSVFTDPSDKKVFKNWSQERKFQAKNKEKAYKRKVHVYNDSEVTCLLKHAKRIRFTS